MPKFIAFLVFFLLTSYTLLAERNSSQEREVLPPYLRGIPWQGKRMKHGYLRWVEKKPYTPLLNSEASKRGSEIYLKNCFECHGVDGQGNGPTAKKTGFQAANLKKVSKDLSNHYLAFQIQVGTKDMPAWVDVLTEDEIWDLTHYLHDLAMKQD